MLSRILNFVLIHIYVHGFRTPCFVDLGTPFTYDFRPP
jgi:hypothetical protein